MPNGFPSFLQLKPEVCSEELTIWATVSSRSCVFWLYRASSSLVTKNIINLISLLAIWWCPCVVSCVVGKGYLLWSVCSLDKNSANLCPASFCTPRSNLLVTCTYDITAKQSKMAICCPLVYSHPGSWSYGQRCPGTPCSAFTRQPAILSLLHKRISSAEKGGHFWDPACLLTAFFLMYLFLSGNIKSREIFFRTKESLDAQQNQKGGSHVYQLWVHIFSFEVSLVNPSLRKYRRRIMVLTITTKWWLHAHLFYLFSLVRSWGWSSDYHAQGYTACSQS